MFKVASRRLVLFQSFVFLTLGFLLIPGFSLAIDDTELAAITPTAYLENSQIMGLGKKIKILRMPTLDSTGKKHYKDLDIVLTINNSGAPAKSATVTSKESPDPTALGFIPGTYDDGAGGTCTLGVSTVAGGRTAGALACKNKDGKATYNANWVTGPVAGHPFEAYLVAAGIDKISGAENVAWGTGLSATGNWVYACFANAGHVISAHQAGGILAINNFGNDSKIECTYNFSLVQ